MLVDERDLGKDLKDQRMRIRCKKCIELFPTLPHTNKSIKTFVRHPSSGFLRHLADTHKIYDPCKTPTTVKDLMRKSRMPYNREVFLDLICQWIVSTDQPFTVVESSSFLAMFEYVAPNFVHDIVKGRCYCVIFR